MRRETMHVATGVLIVSAAAFAARGAQAAAPLNLSSERPPFEHSWISPDLSRSLESRRPEYRLDERPLGELIAVKLGIAQGRAELFRYRVENGPSDKTMLDGVVDGGGLKLKLSW